MKKVTDTSWTRRDERESKEKSENERKSKEEAIMVMIIRFNMFDHYYTTKIAYNDV